MFLPFISKVLGNVVFYNTEALLKPKSNNNDDHDDTSKSLHLVKGTQPLYFKLTLPSNLEYSLKGLFSCRGHCSRRTDNMDCLPELGGFSLRDFFSNSDFNSWAEIEKDKKKKSLSLCREDNLSTFPKVFLWILKMACGGRCWG